MWDRKSMCPASVTMYLVTLVLFWVIIYDRAKAEYCSASRHSTSCNYECHCLYDYQCKDGCRTGQCQRLGALTDHTWGEAACQTGDVGFNKPANMTGPGDDHQTVYPAYRALDGYISPFDDHCAHPRDGATTPADRVAAEWMTDLGALYKIYNITVYGNQDSYDDRLEKFNLNVLNSSGEMELCGYQSNSITYYPQTTICSPPLIGRYVQLKKVEEGAHACPLCEVVITGHRIYDCSECPGSCDDLTGCHSCQGSYQPECKPGCDIGRYGINCDERCGRCSYDWYKDTCNRLTGVCPYGSCIDGYYDIKCDQGCQNCEGATCNFVSGECDRGCKPGWYGSPCINQCSANCNQSSCDVNNGVCQYGCKNGFYGGHCSNQCSANCNRSSCDVNNGVCQYGCKNGFYGGHCRNRCSANCNRSSCDVINGVCQYGCKHGFYGEYCTDICTKHCKNGATCDHESGNCPDGCTGGFYSDNCTKICSENCKYAAACDDKNGNCPNGCTGGFYGGNCTEICSGHCKNGAACDDEVGDCNTGCELWWAGDKCNSHIGSANYKDEVVHIISHTSHSLTIQWQQLHTISTNIRSFYGYEIKYKIEGHANYGDWQSVSHTGDGSRLSSQITQLEHNSDYEIQIIPFRRMDGTSDHGKAYPRMQQKTDCIPPEPPLITNYTLSVAEDDGLPNITIKYQAVTEPNCDEIVSMNIRYGSSKFVTEPLQLTGASYTITPHKEGEYLIVISAENNEKYTSRSKELRVTVKAKISTPGGEYFTIIVITCIVFGVVLLCIVGLAYIWNHRKLCFAASNRSTDDNILNVVTAGQASQSQANRGNQSGNERNSQVSNRSKFGIIAQLNLTGPSKSNKAQAASHSNATSSGVKSSVSSKPGTKKAHGTFDAVVPDDDIYVNSVAVTTSVLVDDFENYVARRLARVQDLHGEYSDLPKEDLTRCSAALTENNKAKNRFRNIYAYDDTRVLLNVDGQNQTDYINADYITGYNGPKEYIATQGTRQNTVKDFWQMVWQEKSNRIVMVANPVEAGKARVEPYWPETLGQTVTVGDFKLQTESVDSTADYNTRIISVRKGKEYRSVRHFHFTTWEDKNKPVYGIHTLFAFYNKIHASDRFAKGPLIVHCSAGVGRTGTFIALDILQNVATKDATIDVYACVHGLRSERMFMVQTKEQYVFLHKAVADFIKCGKMSYNRHTFSMEFATIGRQRLDEATKSVLHRQLKLLCSLKVAKNTNNKDGLAVENRHKNRNLDIIPDNVDRLFIAGGENGNYINAVAVDSFHAHNSYVVTQTPLPNAMPDFWQLVIEQNCLAIVMLNVIHGKDQTCVPYWSDTVNTKQVYGQIEVELVAVDVDNNTDYIVSRDFKISRKATKVHATPEVMMVRHFQLLSWPHQEPPDRFHILDLMDQVRNWQRQNKDPEQSAVEQRKILVHCIDGGSHSGMYCGARYMLDKLDAEEEVDPFLAVRYVTRRRPQFFTKLDEYQFLYQMAAEYISRNNTYANL